MRPSTSLVASPNREEIKRHTDDEQRDWAMNYYRGVARVSPGEQL
jgi:hypothetical protein